MKLSYLHGSMVSETWKIDWNRKTAVNKIRKKLSHLINF